MKRPCDSEVEVEDGILLGSMIAIVYVQLSSTHWTSTIWDKFFPTVEIMIGRILFEIKIENYQPYTYIF